MGIEKYIKFDLNKNLKEKEVLIEELKKLINISSKTNEKYLKFKKIQENWLKIGPVPRPDDEIIWNNFQHHIKNFYDYLHLNRKFKEIDIKYNLDQKEKIINQAKELVKSEDKPRSYKFLLRLNKKWKYEIGPINKEEDIQLNKIFAEIGLEIYKNKKEFEKNKELILIKNFIKKEILLIEINDLISKECTTTKEWQNKIQEFEKIKKTLEKTGPIPIDKKNNYWKNYKETIKKYYLSKNVFFKKLKNTYIENILKQEELINKVEDLKKKENFEVNKKEIILIQKIWKKINPVPYKENEKNWKKFNLLCNYFFKKMDKEKENKIIEIKKKEEKQKKFLKDIQNNLLEINLDDVLIKWKELGSNNKNTDNQFEKIVHKILKSSGLSDEDSKIKLFEIKTQEMDKSEKNKKIINLNKELEILNKKVSTLENNLSFFNEKSKESKLLNKVHKDIERNKKQIENIISQKRLLKN